MNTPWGHAQHVTELAEGILSVSTAGHGGIKLDKKRNAIVPDYMRRAGGWYEEDCEWSIPATIFPVSFAKNSPHDIVKMARDSFRNWYPADYERYYACAIEPGESYMRDKELFERDNAHKWVVISALSTSDGRDRVEYFASLGGTRGHRGQQLHGFLSHEEYDTRGQFGYVLSDQQVEQADACTSDSTFREVDFMVNV